MWSGLGEKWSGTGKKGMQCGQVWVIRIRHVVRYLLTLFPTAYPFPQLKTYLGVIDSNFFIHTNKTMSN